METTENKDTVVEYFGVILGSVLATFVIVGLYAFSIWFSWNYVVYELVSVNKMNYLQALISSGMLFLIRFAIKK